jgi:hypothetical protein
MANELSLAASISYDDGDGDDFVFALPANVRKTLTTLRYFKGKMSVGTSEVAIQLGSLTTLGYYLFINWDSSNFIELRVSAGGTKFARLDANRGMAMGKFGSGITAPYAIADTAPCEMRYCIWAI